MASLHVEIEGLRGALGQTQEEGSILRRQVGREGGREEGGKRRKRSDDITLSTETTPP